MTRSVFVRAECQKLDSCLLRGAARKRFKLKQDLEGPLVTYTINVGGFDKEAIADEVVRSASRVLRLAGFSEAQVADIFGHAAHQINSGETVELDHSDDVGHYVEDDGDNEGIWGIADKFEQIKPVKSLSRLGKRANALNDIDDSANLAKAVSIATEAAGLRKEALDWLRNEASKAGIEMVADRHHWTEIATDEQLDNEENLIFLDDYRWSGDFNWHLISQIARALAETGDKDALLSFSHVFLDKQIAVERDIRNNVERAVQAAGRYEEFLTFVQSHSEAGELAQAEFLDRFVRSSGFSGGTHTLEIWLERMAKRGELERFKRSNRWRINIG